MCNGIWIWKEIEFESKNGGHLNYNRHCMSLLNSITQPNNVPENRHRQSITAGNASSYLMSPGKCRIEKRKCPVAPADESIYISIRLQIEKNRTSAYASSSVLSVRRRRYCIVMNVRCMCAVCVHVHSGGTLVHPKIHLETAVTDYIINECITFINRIRKKADKKTRIPFRLGKRALAFNI